MLDLDRRPPERVPTVLAPGLTGTTFSTKLPAELISTKLPVEDRPAPARSAADRAGLVDCLVAVIKLSLTFDPTSRRAAIPKAEADHLNGESFQGDDPEGIALYGGDLSPYKRLVDVTLGLPSQLRPEKQRALVVGAMRREVRGAGVLPFAALHPFQAPRNEQMGTYDEAWLRDRWPYFPKDFNFDYYNAAPIQQRLERLNGDEEVGLEGFFDDSVRTRLPGITTRAFAQCSVAFGYRFVELALRLDTLHIDLATNSIQLVWRGQFPISNALAPELSQLYACADRLDTPMSIQFVRERFARQIEREQPPATERASAIAGIPRQFGVLSAEQDAERQSKRGALHSQLPPAGGPGRARPRATPAMSRENVERLIASGEELAGRDFTGCDLKRLDLSGRQLRGSIFTAADLAGASLGGAILSAAVLSHAKLVAADLGCSTLDECDLSSADLTQANLQGATLERADFNGANLTGAKLAGAKLRGATLTSALLESADLSEADLTQANLTQAEAPRANFRKATLVDTVAYELFAPEAVFEGADMTRFRASDAELPRAFLRGVNAPGSNLECANLSNATLDLAVFDDATLAHCKLEAAKLRSLRARTASFRYANLRRADLRRADLMESNFEHADLREADLRASSLYDTETLDAELAGVRLADADTSGSKLSHPLLGIKEQGR